MKSLLTLIFLLYCLSASAQINAGMPDIDDVVNTFFSNYSYPNTGEKYLHLEKRKAGWFVTEFDVRSGNMIQPSLKFWDRAKASYAHLPFVPRLSEDSANRILEVSFFKERFLDEFQLYKYRHNLYYGYDDWAWDIIQTVTVEKRMTDSLYETLGMASSHYALGYLSILREAPSINEDPDRSNLADTQPISKERVNKCMAFLDHSIEAYAQLGKRSPFFRTMRNEARYSASVEKMEAYSILQFCGYEEAARKYLKDVIFPDSIMNHARQVLQLLDKNSILLSDNFVESYALFYLQGTGVRRDIISIYRPLLIQRRALMYFDRKYPGDLLGIDSAVYMKPQYDYAFFQQDLPDNQAVALSTFLDRLEKSPYLSKLSQGNKTELYVQDSTLKFFSKNVFLQIDKQRAEKLYGKTVFPDRISIPIERDYLLMDEIIWMYIVNKNFLKRKIYYLFPYYNDPVNTGVKKRGLYWELTPA